MASRIDFMLTVSSLLFSCLLLPSRLSADDLTLFPRAVPLKSETDFAAEMVAGIDRFLLKQTEQAAADRKRYWDLSAENREQTIADNREHLKWVIGLRDERVSYSAPEVLATVEQSAQIGSASTVLVNEKQVTHHLLRIRWPVVAGIAWEGLLIEPVAAEGTKQNLIILPEAGISYEQWLENPEHQSALQRILSQQARVIFIEPIGRTVRPRRRVELTDREFVYRTSFEMGRHPLGYEVQAVLAIHDWLDQKSSDGKTFLYGQGEGGLIALLAAAVEPKIDGVGVAGYFGDRQQLWTEPLDRNLFDYLTRFSDVELCALIAPRPLVVHPLTLPEKVIETNGGGPGRIKTPDEAETSAAYNKTKDWLGPIFPDWKTDCLLPGDEQPDVIKKSLALLTDLDADDTQVSIGISLEQTDPAAYELRQVQLVEQITARNQLLVDDAVEVRKQFFSQLDTTSLEKYEQTIKPYRDYFRERVIGQFAESLLPPNPRIRKSIEAEQWTGYEVQLDVFEDVFAYGYLLIPKALDTNKRYPVVVCQHGLEGVPLDCIQGDHRAYHNFAAQLAEKGYIVFAPQNPYRGQDLFRTLQRKANPLGKTLFSIIVPQHQQITDWLASLDFVDDQKIGFYGLSYGGKTAMRVPPLVANYALSICSADFNDWIRKNVSTTAPFSYVWTGEYEIWEFDLGNTFNYAEMAALIAPRPFMVERGHFDGVGPDDWVASEFANVRHLYQAKLKLNGKAQIEWFDGPHTIHGQGTFQFLDRHLRGK